MHEKKVHGSDDGALRARVNKVVPNAFMVLLQKPRPLKRARPSSLSGYSKSGLRGRGNILARTSGS
eukprot:1156168-Pelagomonas_calceolata.AAC.2